MVAAVHQSFSAAASVAPIKMWSNSHEGSVYLCVKNSFLDFYTDETKAVKGNAIARSSSAEALTPSAKAKMAWGHEAGMSESTRSPSPSTCGEGESVDGGQPQDLPQRKMVPSATVPLADLPVLQDRKTGPSAAGPKADLPVLVNFISLSNALPLKSKQCAEKANANRTRASGPAGNATAHNTARSDNSKADISKLQTPAESDVTTVMIRGIPCSLSKKTLMDTLDHAGLAGKYDFFYLPKGSSNGNLGYAFVNFVHPMYVGICKAVMHGASLDPVRSAKFCTISAADIQGLHNLRKHFRHAAVSRSEHGPVFLKVY